MNSENTADPSTCVHSAMHTYVRIYVSRYVSTYVHTVYREIFMGQNFQGFRSWPNICENKIRELGIIVLSFCKVSQHLRKFYLGIFIFGAIRENFPLYSMYVCKYIHTYVHRSTLGYFAAILLYTNTTSSTWQIICNQTPYKSANWDMEEWQMAELGDGRLHV